MRTSTVVAVGLFALGLSGIVAVALPSVRKRSQHQQHDHQPPHFPNPPRTEVAGCIADEQGRLKQQYRADTLEPAPMIWDRAGSKCKGRTCG